MVIDGVEWLPVSFVPKLVKSILADEKTETRRIISGAPHEEAGAKYSCLDGGAVIETARVLETFKSRYGRPSTRLWVREAFVAAKMDGRFCKIDEAELVIFRDGAKKFRTGTIHKPEFREAPLSGYRPPMHLPFWASRISLEVKRVGVERVQDITEAAAVAEGFVARSIRTGWKTSGVSSSERSRERGRTSPRSTLIVTPMSNLGGSIIARWAMVPGSKTFSAKLSASD